jgi:hypothetical protein
MMSWFGRLCVGQWLLGLFFLAQIVGVAPLTTTHLQHVGEIQRDIATDLAGMGAANHAHHHHLTHDGDRHDHAVNDPADQCCTLHHHLAGVVPVPAVGHSHGYVIAPLMPFPTRLLIDAEQGRLERPPKPPLTV